MVFIYCKLSCNQKWCLKKKLTNLVFSVFTFLPFQTLKTFNPPSFPSPSPPHSVCPFSERQMAFLIDKIEFPCLMKGKTSTMMPPTRLLWWCRWWTPHRGLSRSTPGTECSDNRAYNGCGTEKSIPFFMWNDWFNQYIVRVELKLPHILWYTDDETMYISPPPTGVASALPPS